MQQTAFACQSKAFTHMPQRDLYRTMYTLGNSILLRCETEMTRLQHHLEQTGRQELRNSPFWSSPLFQFKLVKEGAEFHRKKPPPPPPPPKTVRVLDPIRISPFTTPMATKEAPTGNVHMGIIPLEAVTNHFLQAGRTSEAPEVILNLTLGDEGMETPLPSDSLKASLSSPVGGPLRSFRRDWQTEKCSNNVLNIITNDYILPFITKPKLARRSSD